MIKEGKGGSNTKTGLEFEIKMDLATFLSKQKGYFVNDGKEVYYKNELVGTIFKKDRFKKFLKELNIPYKEIVSHVLKPDDSIYVLVNNTLFILEYKTQKKVALLMKNYKHVTIKRSIIKD